MVVLEVRLFLMSEGTLHVSVVAGPRKWREESAYCTGLPRS